MGRRKINLYLRGKIWWCWFYDHRGKRHRESTHQTDRTLARKAARRIEREFFDAPDRAPLPLDEAYAMMMASAERKRRSAATLDFYLKKSKPLLRLLGAATDVHDLNLARAEAYWDIREEEGAGLHTVKKELGALRTALRHAKRHGRYEGDPSCVMPDGLDNAYTPGDRALTTDEYHKLRAALAPKRRPHLDAYVGLGMSDSVLYRITASDVDFSQKVVRVPGTKTAHRERWIPINDDLCETLSKQARRAEPGAPLFEPWSNVRRDLHSACERAEIAPVSPNDLRRTFATWLAEAGVAELVVASLMGHANSAMVRRVYAKIGTNAKRAAIRGLPTLGTPNEAATTVTAGVTEKAPNRGRSGRHGRRASTHQKAKTPQNSGVSGVPRDGIEPPTRGFSIPCSTN